MKKLFNIFLTLILSITAICVGGCGADKGGNDGTLSFYAPDGAPALAIAKFINDGENFGLDANVEYEVVSSGKIGGVMAKGDGDFIVMPVNLASKLYKGNEKSAYVMTAVITHGNLYLMSSDGIETLEQLKGKVVGVIGQGLVPDLTFRAVLSDNNLAGDIVEGDTPSAGKITLRYFSRADELIPMLKQGKLTVGLLPEPAATNLTKVSTDKKWTSVDLQALYDAQTKAYPQAVLMVKKSLYDANKSKINGMKTFFDQNIQWIKQNVSDAVNAVNGKLEAGLTPSLNQNNITEKVIDNCKIYYQSATDAKSSVENYIDKIIALNPQSASVVGQDFFAK